MSKLKSIHEETLLRLYEENDILNIEIIKNTEYAEREANNIH